MEPYWQHPAMHCDWWLLPGSSGLRRCRRPRPVCSGGRARCGGRKGSRWAGACGGSGGHLGLSRRAPHPCTTLWKVGVGLPPCSWEWRVPPWTQSNPRGPPQSWARCLQTASGTLWRLRQMFFVHLSMNKEINSADGNKTETLYACGRAGKWASNRTLWQLNLKSREDIMFSQQLPLKRLQLVSVCSYSNHQTAEENMIKLSVFKTCTLAGGRFAEAIWKMGDLHVNRDRFRGREESWRSSWG